MEEIIQQQNIQITVSDYQEKVRHNQIKWLESDLIPKLLAIFEILDKFSTILLSIKNDDWTRILSA